MNTIIDKSIELFLTQGAKTVTMDDVCTCCGISKKTLYQHYTNKEKLLEEVMICISNKIEESISSVQQKKMNPIEELLEIYRQVFNLIQSDKDVFMHQLYKYYPDIYEKLKCKKFDNFYNVLFTNFKLGKEQGLYQFIIDKEILIRFIFIIDQSIKNREFDDITDDIKKLFKDLFTFIIMAIVTEKGNKFYQTIKIKYG